MTKYMTPKEVAGELEVSAATVVRWVREGLIPAMRFGQRIIKIPRTEIERLMDGDRVEVK
jgi:excisionase family DNA binding protein